MCYLDEFFKKEPENQEYASVHLIIHQSDAVLCNVDFVEHVI